MSRYGTLYITHCGCWKGIEIFFVHVLHVQLQSTAFQASAVEMFEREFLRRSGCFLVGFVCMNDSMSLLAKQTLTSPY